MDHLTSPTDGPLNRSTVERSLAARLPNRQLFESNIAMHANTATPSAQRRRPSGTQPSHFCKTETANFDSNAQTAQAAFPSSRSSDSDPQTSRPVALATPPAPRTRTGCARSLPARGTRARAEDRRRVRCATILRNTLFLRATGAQKKMCS